MSLSFCYLDRVPEILQAHHVYATIQMVLLCKFGSSHIPTFQLAKHPVLPWTWHNGEFTDVLSTDVLVGFSFYVRRVLMIMWVATYLYLSHLLTVGHHPGVHYIKWVVQVRDKAARNHLSDSVMWATEFEQASTTWALSASLDFSHLQACIWLPPSAKPVGGYFFRPWIEAESAVMSAITLRHRSVFARYVQHAETMTQPVASLSLVLFFDGVTISGHGATKGMFRFLGKTTDGHMFTTKVANLYDVWGGETKVWGVLLDNGQGEIADTPQKEVQEFIQEYELYPATSTLARQREPYSVLQLWQIAVKFLKKKAVAVCVTSACPCLLAFATRVVFRTP